MKKILYIISFLLPLTLLGQSQKVFVISDSTLADRWSNLSENWRYQKGDNMAWANPDFDDSSWEEFSAYNLNMPDGEKAIANRGEIVWFRKRIKADSSLSKAIVLNIHQEGASEIYLDGKLIHQLGKVSSGIDEVIYNNPYSQVLQLPLEKGKEQVLAVRYVNAQYKFPIYANTNGVIRISTSSLSNANSTDLIKNNRIAFNRQFENNYHIALGLAILMFIIFLSFFLFFPNEKINGYFAASILFLILFLVGVIWSIGRSGIEFWITFSYDTSIVLSSIILLYCLYRILEQNIDVVYNTVSFLGLIAIAGFFLYNPNTVAPTWALILYVAIIRIAVQSWNKNRVAGILFISSSFIGLLYWALIVLNDIGLLQFYIREFIPFAFMLNPLVLAIYLGYAFGKRSQELRLNLERVQKLSKEKESILSSQNETLEKQVQERTASLNQSIEDLKSAQDQLIQQEKLASLGQLTAGIAHEIKNPLNFVNNFSELSVELIEETKEELSAVSDQLSAEDREKVDEALEILNDIEMNLRKIHEHGSRADSIVKSMLEHSRGGSGKLEPTDLNALVKEFVNLSFHGMRAGKNPINVDLNFELDETIGEVPLITEDFSRVIVNLCNNAFDAMREKANPKDLNSKDLQGLQDLGGLKDYQPKLTVRTKTEKGNVVVEMQDNGLGIPEEIKNKIMQPFFTTKKGIEGTGLGLSITNDIVKAHGGSMDIHSQPGQTVFTIKLNG